MPRALSAVKDQYPDTGMSGGIECDGVDDGHSRGTAQTLRNRQASPVPSQRGIQDPNPESSAPRHPRLLPWTSELFPLQLCTLPLKPMPQQTGLGQAGG